MKETHKQIRKTIILIAWLGIWQAAAVWTDNPILLAGPVQILRALAENLLSPDFFPIVFHSLARIGLGFFLALFAGMLLGAGGYRMTWVEEVLAPVMTVLKSVPVASFVVLLLIWFGSGRLSFLISFLIVFPNVYVNTLAGLKSTDEKLLEMARVFEMGGGRRFFYLYRPALVPHLESCLRISLGMSWKSGVAAEIIGLPESSLGERLYMSKIYLDTAGLFAWTITIVFVSFLFEKAVLRLFRRFAEWRPYPVFGWRESFHTVLHFGEKKGHKSGAESINGAPTGKLCTPTAVKRLSWGVCGGGNRHREETVGKAGCRTGSEGGGESGLKIRMLHIEKFYSAQPVVRDFNLTMEPGGRYLLMGPSGAGKTTLLRILAGLEQADRGEVEGASGRIGMVFQEDRLCEEYDAVCNILLGMETGGRLQSESYGMGDLSKKQLIESVKVQAASILPEECLTKPVGTLSGGMRRRVALLRAVLSGADMLVMDEPFTGLDEKNRVRCAEYVTEQLRGRTLLVTSHREEDVELLQGRKIYC